MYETELQLQKLFLDGLTRSAHHELQEIIKSFQERVDLIHKEGGLEFTSLTPVHLKFSDSVISNTKASIGFLTRLLGSRRSNTHSTNDESSKLIEHAIVFSIQILVESKKLQNGDIGVISKEDLQFLVIGTTRRLGNYNTETAMRIAQKCIGDFLEGIKNKKYIGIGFECTNIGNTIILLKTHQSTQQELIEEAISSGIKPCTPIRISTTE